MPLKDDDDEDDITGGGHGGWGNKNEGAEPQRMPWQERVAVSLHLLEMMSSSSDDCSAGITWQADTQHPLPSPLSTLCIPRGNT